MKWSKALRLIENRFLNMRANVLYSFSAEELKKVIDFSATIYNSSKESV